MLLPVGSYVGSSIERHVGLDTIICACIASLLLITHCRFHSHFEPIPAVCTGVCPSCTSVQISTCHFLSSQSQALTRRAWTHGRAVKPVYVVLISRIRRCDLPLWLQAPGAHQRPNDSPMSVRQGKGGSVPSPSAPLNIRSSMEARRRRLGLSALQVCILSAGNVKSTQSPVFDP